jgi:uncharacterized protein (DUF697 family)/tellurite resistance protein
MTTHLTKPEQEALVTLALMAAFADGGKSDVERSEVKRITESLDGGDLSTSALYQRVLLRQATPADAVAPLTAHETRQLAYEMAVYVCEADDALNEAEQRFLAELRRELKLDDQATAAFQQQADALTQAPLVTSTAAATAPPPPQTASAADAEVDRMVLNYSILNGALELLPESLATMAIVPVQMKMVYRIGKRYGYDLDRRHITELLGAAGVGLTSQVVEGFARKLLGGLLGKVAGGLGRRAGNQLASSAMSFASTYALGQMAQRYYAGGRSLSALQLKELFTSLTEQARSLHSRYAGEIQQRASNLNPSQLLNLVHGNPGIPQT